MPRIFPLLVSLLVSLSAWLPSRPAHAQLRIDAFTSSVTASGPPGSAWFTVRNDGDEALRLEVRSVSYVREGVTSPLRILGLELDGARHDGLVTIPAHGAVRLVVYLHGFPLEPERSEYAMRIALCGPGRSGACREGQTLVQRAHRDPIRR